MSDYIKKISDDEKFTGQLIQVIDRHFEYSKNGQKGNFTIEIARRPPGVRLIIVKDNQILLTKEYRSELEDWDYRLPGGKVFDSLDEYLRHGEDENVLLKKSIAAVLEEGREEAGIHIRNPQLYHIAKAGGTIEWDLHYYLVDDFDILSEGAATETTEIIHPKWFSLDQAKAMCLNGDIKEDRSLGVLLKYILNKT